MGHEIDELRGFDGVASINVVAAMRKDAEGVAYRSSMTR